MSIFNRAEHTWRTCDVGGIRLKLQGCSVSFAQLISIVQKVNGVVNGLTIYDTDTFFA